MLRALACSPTVLRPSCTTRVARPARRATPKGHVPHDRRPARRQRGVVSAASGDEKEITQSVKSVRTVCWLSFWSQLALSLTSAGIFFFTVFVTRSRPVSSIFLLVGVAASLISTGIIRKILDDARRVMGTADITDAFEKWNATGWLLRNTDINLIGMASSIIALQGECGMLVAKLLRTSTPMTPYQAPTQGAPASIDVFAVQGCANVLLAHFVSLFFLTYALRLLQRLISKRIASR